MGTVKLNFSVFHSFYLQMSTKIVLLEILVKFLKVFGKFKDIDTKSKYTCTCTCS